MGLAVLGFLVQVSLWLKNGYKIVPTGCALKPEHRQSIILNRSRSQAMNKLIDQHYASSISLEIHTQETSKSAFQT